MSAAFRSGSLRIVSGTCEGRWVIYAGQARVGNGHVVGGAAFSGRTKQERRRDVMGMATHLVPYEALRRLGLAWFLLNRRHGAGGGGHDVSARRSAICHVGEERK